MGGYFIAATLLLLVWVATLLQLTGLPFSRFVLVWVATLLFYQGVRVEWH